jgi:hypothetical protein
LHSSQKAQAGDPQLIRITARSVLERPYCVMKPREPRDDYRRLWPLVIAIIAVAIAALLFAPSEAPSE